MAATSGFPIEALLRILTGSFYVQENVAANLVCSSSISVFQKRFLFGKMLLTDKTNIAPFPRHDIGFSRMAEKKSRN